MTIDETNKVELYSVGICHASACAPEAMTGDEVADAANGIQPTGLDHGWAISSDETFRSGQPNPCVCNSDAGRRHWLLSC